MQPNYTELLAAITFAAHKHRDQRRKDAAASPYINHPLALAHVLATEGGVTDLKTLIAAVLHDTVEDTETTYTELVDHFGRKVADVVMEVTDDKSLAKVDRAARWSSWQTRSATCVTWPTTRRQTGRWRAGRNISTGPKQLSMVYRKSTSGC